MTKNKKKRGKKSLKLETQKKNAHYAANFSLSWNNTNQAE